MELFAALELGKKLFYEFNKQLSELNFIIGKGTIVYATISQALAKPSSKRDNDADFTIKRDKCNYGYKGNMLLRKSRSTWQVFTIQTCIILRLAKQNKQCLQTKDAQINLGKRHSFKRHLLRHIGQRLQNRALSKKQQMKNRVLSSIRNAVERPFFYKASARLFKVQLLQHQTE